MEKMQSEGVNHYHAVTKQKTIPFAIYILTIGIFSMVTSEFQVTGMVSIMAHNLNVSISQISYLVSLYSLSMAFGGPLLATGLLKTPPKNALIILYVIFIAAEMLGALANSYSMLVVARLITGSSGRCLFWCRTCNLYRTCLRSTTGMSYFSGAGRYYGGNDSGVANG
ncbi:MFS transporter [Xenorhabdus szentirmaii]|uniref:MFS transporter n=1 Tax=Xenorhabdus szentirmaii TaxID=290112 RepID=UPI0032B7CF36